MRTRGFALIAVLWGLVVAGALASAYLGGARHAVRASANRAAELRARTAAEAGLARAHNTLERLHVLGLDGARALDIDSRTRLAYVWNHLDSTFAPISSECLPDACYELRVRDLATLLNVNLAGEDRLRRLFLAVGATYREADVAAQSIADWIDADDLHRARGAERGYYAALPFPYEPPNRPIRDLRELRRVRGMDGRLYDLAVPYLTVDGDERVNLNAAPEPVLRTVPGFGEEAVRMIVQARRRGVIFANAFQLTLRLSPDGRARIQDAFDRFIQVAAFEPARLEAVSVGRDRNGDVRLPLRAIYARAGERVAQISRERTDR